MHTEAEIKALREKLEHELEELDDEEQLLGSLPPEARLAESLHNLLCRWNHTDGCSWMYESWERPGSAHQQYVTKARQVMSLLPDKTADEICEIAEVLR